ncbi:hypothetical protein MKW92_025948 [Papaver armeniacum]|nr:hypothetical protein MKW92_025948 [Papaver armeniacum]
MSGLKTTQLVVALSLCLLLLGFFLLCRGSCKTNFWNNARCFHGYADVAAANQQCSMRDYCLNDNVDECNKTCLRLRYRGGICLEPDSSSNREEKIDVRFALVTLHPCCCYH